MKEGRRLGVGVIGCGHISAAYCRLMPLFGSIALRAVADLDAEAAKMRGAEAGVCVGEGPCCQCMEPSQGLGGSRSSPSGA